MARIPVLSFDRGTLILHPPPRGKAWIEFATWDDRIEKFRIPAIQYRALVERLQAEATEFQDDARHFSALELPVTLDREPYAHQQEALAAWKAAGRRGVVVLPTGAGKSYLAQMALAATPRTTLIVVPTLDLMHQWYASLEMTFPGVEVGLLGGGSRDRSPILVATYDSAAIQAETLGNRYALAVFDECHHLPSDFNRVIAEFSLAPYRLGLTATPDRSDGRHQDLQHLIGPEVYHRSAVDLSGIALADYEVRQIKVRLSTEERDRYTELLDLRNRFLRQNNLSLGGLGGWQHFIQVSARSAAGRRAMLAHHEAKSIALGTAGKIQVLAELLADHDPEQVLIFTNDNATVYRISQDFLIPAITHQTPVKERHHILTQFRAGTYKTLVVANVLDEGVDVPDVRIAVFLAGSGSTRQFIQRLGRVLRRGSGGQKQAVLYEVVAEDTVEERTSQRRRKTRFDRSATDPDRQLHLVVSATAADAADPADRPKPSPVHYGQRTPKLPTAAESGEDWPQDSPELEP
ncbi:MAG: DEAD/DEAH box helicase family protein [Prochlorothrix sp.]|nr:DEAD/DEAH box helicase family protein [Prochlorothrix sp.]